MAWDFHYAQAVGITSTIPHRNRQNTLDFRDNQTCIYTLNCINLVENAKH